MPLRTADQYREEKGSSRGFGRIILSVGLAFLLCLGAYLGFARWSRTPDAGGGVTPSAATASQPLAPPASPSQPAGAPSVATPRHRVQVSDQRTHGDWRHACLNRDDGARTCSIVQSLLHRETRQLLVSWRIIGGGTSLTSVWQTPQNVLVSSGLRIDAGLPEPILVPYQNCNASHCVSSVRLADAFVDRMKNVSELAVTMVLADGKTLRFPISTKGLAAAIEDLRTGGGGN